MHCPTATPSISSKMSPFCVVRSSVSLMCFCVRAFTCELFAARHRAQRHMDLNATRIGPRAAGQELCMYALPRSCAGVSKISYMFSRMERVWNASWVSLKLRDFVFTATMHTVNMQQPSNVLAERDSESAQLSAGRRWGCRAAKGASRGTDHAAALLYLVVAAIAACGWQCHAKQGHPCARFKGPASRPDA